MKSLIAAFVLALGCTACASQQHLALPPLLEAPEEWPSFIVSTVSGPACPPIEGVYLEPPSIHRLGVAKKYTPKTDRWLFIGPIPFSRSDEEHLPLGTEDIPQDGFMIRQPASSTFDFYFYNHEATAISKSRFREEDGDFECHDGYIEFPTLVAYGMSEAGLLNFQVRNVLLLDETGALVIQSTRGPYRGNPSQMQREVSYEFIRYPRAESARP